MNTQKMKYRKKPVVIEAYQTDKEIIIHTLEGDMKASIGDYIITGVDGEQYPCKPDIFEKTYNLVENENSIINTGFIKGIKNWTEVTRGIYRYVISDDQYYNCYEIHLEQHCLNRDILTAKASLYVAGNWVSEVKDENDEVSRIFGRKCLLKSSTVRECLDAAYKGLVCEPDVV